MSRLRLYGSTKGMEFHRSTINVRGRAEAELEPARRRLGEGGDAHRQRGRPPREGRNDARPRRRPGAQAAATRSGTNPSVPDASAVQTSLYRGGDLLVDPSYRRGSGSTAL